MLRVDREPHRLVEPFQLVAVPTCRPIGSGRFRTRSSYVRMLSGKTLYRR